MPPILSELAAHLPFCTLVQTAPHHGTQRRVLDLPAHAKLACPQFTGGKMTRRRQIPLQTIIIIVATIFAAPTRAQQSNFTVGTASAAPGQKATGFIDVPPGIDAATHIPVVIFRGTKPGPVLAIVSGDRKS